MSNDKLYFPWKYEQNFLLTYEKKIYSNLNFSMYIWLHIKYSIYELIFLHVCFFSVWFCSWPQGSKHNKAQVKPLLAKRKALHFAKRCSNLTEKMACKEDQSRIISLKRGFVPENPVCDSGIFCYGKKFLKIKILNILKKKFVKS